jgi:hypothetical protein
MAAQPQTLKYRTDCRICGQAFIAAPLDIAIVGQANERLVHFVQKLAEHLQEKHPEAMQLIGMNIQDITGFLIVSVFQTQDPTLAGKLEGVRHTLHTVTRRIQITDQTIVEGLARLGMSTEEIEKVSPIMRDMRDALTEQGLYAPNSQPSNLVTL